MLGCKHNHFASYVSPYHVQSLCIHLANACGACLTSMRPRGVMVSTLDSESSDRGSNPRETCPAPAPEAPSQAESWRRGAHSGLPARGRRTCSGAGRLAMQQQPWARDRPSASSRGRHPISRHPISRAGRGNDAVAARRSRCWWRAQCMAERRCATVAA